MIMCSNDIYEKTKTKGETFAKLITKIHTLVNTEEINKMEKQIEKV